MSPPRRAASFTRHSSPAEALLAEPFDLSSLLGEFRDEARDQLDRLDAALLGIEESGRIGRDERDALLRSLHTLKGNSGMLGLRPLVDTVHAIEEVFKESDLDFSRERLDILFEAAAALRQSVEQAGSATQEESFARLRSLNAGARLGSATAGSTSDAPPITHPDQGESVEADEDESDTSDAATAEGAGEFLRVSFARLDQMLDEVGELTSVTGAIRALVEQYEDELETSGAGEELTELVEQLGRHTRALRSSVMEARLVPVQRVFSRFPSLARDLARQQGKRVRVLMEGGEVELDRSMVEALGDPLLHLVRNAVDHGIRLPEEREAVGKPPIGTITLHASRFGDRVHVEVSDDGEGLDLQALHRRARDLGLADAHTRLSDQEAAELIFEPGFTTRQSSDAVSGRGIGLDVVRERANALRGSLSVRSTPGEGVHFILGLPLTLTILPALVFEAQGGTFAVPSAAVEGTFRHPRPERAGTTELVRLEGELIPVARADRLFGWHERSDDAGGRGSEFAVVLQAGGRRGALLASRVIEQRDLVVKAMPAFLGSLPTISGASIAPDGGVILLLDPAGLIELNLAQHQRENRGFTTSQDPHRRG